jgi:predicted esterase
MRRSLLIVLVLMLYSLALHAQDSLKPIKPIARKLPPKGNSISKADHTKLGTQLAGLDKRLGKIKQRTKKNAKANPVFADAEIYLKAVRYALLHDEFYRKGDERIAGKLLATAADRIKQLETRKLPWAQKRGLVVRGYYSSIDDSAQPYGLVIPEKLDLSKPVPLYVWLHGRGDKTTDMHFISQRQSRAGQIAPPDAIVLHPFGRQCIGFKSAGEIDVLEAIESVSTRYKIDPDRIVLMGFSMGGAGAWHIGAHYTDRFCAVHAGAGFTELRRYQNLDPKKIPDYERALWGLYDVPPYVRNLFNVPTVAYSGQKDKQKLAADIMAEAFEKEGRKLQHIVGPGMGHKYHPESLKQVLATVGKAVKAGRSNDQSQVHIQTQTLRYNHMGPVRILALKKHWQDSRVDLRADKKTAGKQITRITTKNVAAFALDDLKSYGHFEIDGQKIAGVLSRSSEGKKTLNFQLTNGNWKGISKPQLNGKQHGLQGPIDDAFMAPFLVVTPSGTSGNPLFDQWTQFEIKHLQDRWRALFRGELRIKKDTEVTAQDLQKFHIVVWGDSKSNKLLARMLASKTSPLPLKWQNGQLEMNGKKYDAKTHVPLMIHPNPLHPQKYVVINSGPTFREGHDRTNSLQNPKLGDWAVVDITHSPDALTPGRIVAAGFLNEFWKHSK